MMKEAEKKIYEVMVTRAVKSNAEKLIFDAEMLTGEDYDIRNLDDIFDAIEELNFTGAVVVHDTKIVRALTAETAQQFVADLYEKDDFSIVLNIEVHEAAILEA